MSENEIQEEKIRVKVRAEHHHWGWTTINDIPVNTIIGLWGFEINSKEVKFRRPISIDRFDKHCKMVESDYLWYWVYECDPDYIDKLLASRNAKIY